MRLMKAMTIAACLLVGMGAHWIPAQEIALEIGSSAPVNSPWDIGLKKIAAEWSKASDGRVKMVFSKSVSNASQTDLIQKLKFSLDGIVADTIGLGFIDQDFFMLSMPSVIHDDKDFDKAIAAALPILRQRLSDRYEIVTITKAGWVRFFSNQPIRTPEDLRKVRVGVNRSQDALVRLFQSIGIRTVKSDSSSTLLQFNSGALDAMYSSPLFVGALWSQYRKVITHMSPFKVAPFFGALIINKRSWEQIPESLRPLLKGIADRVSAEIGVEADRLEAEAIAAMERTGLIVPPYSAREEAAWDALYAGTVRSQVASWFSTDFSQTIYAALEE